MKTSNHSRDGHPTTRSRGCLVHAFAAIALLLTRIPARAQEAANPHPLATARVTKVVEFADRLPEVLDFALPNLMSRHMYQIYLHPRYGDLLHRDYLRMPMGIRSKAGPMEINAEIQTYFTHGLSGGAGYGFSGMLLGVKHEQALYAHEDVAWSTGVNFSTPLSRPPVDLTDGFRHTIPYVGATYPLYPDWNVTGFSTLAADLIAGTSIEPHFGRNQLHSDALSLTLGAAREYKHFQLSTTLNYTDSSPLSDEHRHVIAFRPGILIPIRDWPVKPIRILLTVGAQVISGPDGHESGFNSSLRVEFDLPDKK